MDIQIISAVIFVVFLIAFLIVKRKNIHIQKILFPALYLILYKSNFGIRFMEKFARKYKRIIKFFGYCCIGFSFLGLIFISVNIILLIYQLIAVPAVQQPGVALVLPFTHVPGVGYLSFFHWIISIFILAIVHEFAHGIVARAHGLKIKNSGFAFFSVFAPLIPAAFVEPDEQKLMKSSDVKQYSVFAVGPIINIILALLIMLAFPYVGNPTKLAPFEDRITEPIGFSFSLTNETSPAAFAGLKEGMIIDSFNNEPIKSATPFLEMMYYCVKPDQTITLGVGNKTYNIKTVPDSSGKRGIIGITGFRNERVVKPEYEPIKHIFYWLKDLFRWLFLFNFFIGLFNLLPLGIVDGGRILDTLLQSTMRDKEKAKKIWSFISLLFVLLIILGLISTYLGNPFAFLK